MKKKKSIIIKPIKMTISILLVLFAFVIKGMYGAWNNTEMEDWVWIAMMVWFFAILLWGFIAYDRILFWKKEDLRKKLKEGK